MSALLGFPSDEQMMDLLGFVEEEDRQRWEQLKESRAQYRQREGTIDKSAKPGFDLAEKSLSNQMHVAQMNRPTERVIREETRWTDTGNDEPEYGG